MNTLCSCPTYHCRCQQAPPPPPPLLCLPVLCLPVLSPQHVIVASPKLLEKHLKAAGSAGMVVDPTKIVWTPYNAERDYANFKG